MRVGSTMLTSEYLSDGSDHELRADLSPATYHIRLLLNREEVRGARSSQTSKPFGRSGTSVGQRSDHHESVLESIVERCACTPRFRTESLGEARFLRKREIDVVIAKKTAAQTPQHPRRPASMSRARWPHH